jgi:hypothetical protein
MFICSALVFRKRVSINTPHLYKGVALSENSVPREQYCIKLVYRDLLDERKPSEPPTTQR